ncbi:MAG TPA: hypothetical protein VFZ08_10170 [Terriglobia bacterium]|nr:hypothetical protein [Terriglobia bacterium]
MARKRNIQFLCAILGILLVGIPLTMANPPAGQTPQVGPLQVPHTVTPGFPTRPSRPGFPPTEIPAGPPALSHKQKSAILTSQFKKTKKDVAALCKMAQSLQEEINKLNPNVLSLDVVNKADKIQKLAKKIRNEAKEY